MPVIPALYQVPWVWGCPPAHGLAGEPKVKARGRQGSVPRLGCGRVLGPGEGTQTLSGAAGTTGKALPKGRLIWFSGTFMGQGQSLSSVPGGLCNDNKSHRLTCTGFTAPSGLQASLRVGAVVLVFLVSKLRLQEVE